MYEIEFDHSTLRLKTIQSSNNSTATPTALDVPYFDVSRLRGSFDAIAQLMVDSISIPFSHWQKQLSGEAAPSTRR